MGNLVQPSPAILVLEEQRLGYASLSLSNFETSGIPEIIGNVEVAGALYTFSAFEAIGDWASVGAGEVWIKLIPALDETISAVWTDIAPAWSDEKQGWYSPTLGEENQRYAFQAYKVDAANVRGKVSLFTRTGVAGAGGVPGRLVFTASGSFVIPPNIDRIYVSGCASGGSGGSGNTGYSGGGGGGGEFIWKRSVSVIPGSAIAVAIGGPHVPTSCGPISLNPGQPGGNATGSNDGAGGAGGAQVLGDEAGAAGAAGLAGSGTPVSGGDSTMAFGGQSGVYGGGGGASLGAAAAYSRASAGGPIGVFKGGHFGGGGGGGNYGGNGGAGGYGGGGGGGGRGSGTTLGGQAGSASIVVEF